MTPRKAPTGERPSDTIAFQNKQIRDLAARIDKLTERNAELDMDRGMLLMELKEARIEAQQAYDRLKADIEAVQAKLAYETAHASGYRQRVYDEKSDMSKIAIERENIRQSGVNASAAATSTLTNFGRPDRYVDF